MPRADTPRLLDAQSFPEIKITRLRECPALSLACDTPDIAYEYWRDHVPNADWYQEGREHAVAFLVNTRKRIIGLTLAGVGTLNSLNIEPRDIFRVAIVHAAAAVIFAHNHPSGDPTPSEADIKVSRNYISAGRILHVELLDSIIIGSPGWCPDDPLRKPWISLRELGYFYS